MYFGVRLKSCGVKFVLVKYGQMSNFTGGGKTNINFEELFGCSVELTSGIHSELIFLSVLNVFLAITAILGNTLILVSLPRVSSLHPPTKFLLRTLATSDLLVGLIPEPLAVIYWTSSMKQGWDICNFVFLSDLVVGYALCGVSLFTVTAMSIDKLLALSLSLGYRQVVTKRRTSIFVCVVWVVSLGCSSLYAISYQIAIRFSYACILLSLTTSIFCYTKILGRLRRHQTQIQDNAQPSQSESIPLNIARYRKAVSNTIWLQVALVVCYLPHGVVSAMSTHIGLSPTTSIVRQFTVTFIFLNSTLNPILYYWKLGGMRQGVRDTIKQLPCSS